MADTVTIRHRTTGAERTVAKSAVAYFATEYDVLDKAGRKAANQPTTPQKEN